MARHPGELFALVGFVVTNLSRQPKRVVAFDTRRGTAKQHINEGKNAIDWIRLSSHGFGRARAR